MQHWWDSAVNDLPHSQDSRQSSQCSGHFHLPAMQTLVSGSRDLRRLSSSFSCLREAWTIYKSFLKTWSLLLPCPIMWHVYWGGLCKLLTDPKISFPFLSINILRQEESESWYCDGISSFPSKSNLFYQVMLLKKNPLFKRIFSNSFCFLYWKPELCCFASAS